MVFSVWVGSEGAVVVTETRRSVGEPHDGQNFLDGSLQSLRGGGAGRRKCQRRAMRRAAAGREGDALEAGVAAEDPAADAPDPAALAADEVEAHLKQHVLDGKVGRHARTLHDGPRLLWLEVVAPGRRRRRIGQGQAEVARLEFGHVGRRDPLAAGRLVVLRVRVVEVSRVLGLVLWVVARVGRRRRRRAGGRARLLLLGHLVGQ